MHELFTLEHRVRAYQTEVEQFLQARVQEARLNEPTIALAEPVRPAVVCTPCATC